MQVDSVAPHAKGVTALEMWMLSCVMMVFAALCEYGLVLLVKRNMNADQDRKKQEGKIGRGAERFRKFDLSKVHQKEFHVYPEEYTREDERRHGHRR